MSEKPPAILDSAKVLSYAILDSSVIYTGKASVYYNGKLVGPVPKLAICQNKGETEVLLFYCNDKWGVDIPQLNQPNNALKGNIREHLKSGRHFEIKSHERE